MFVLNVRCSAFVSIFEFRISMLAVRCSILTMKGPSYRRGQTPRRGDISRVLFNGPFVWDAGLPTPRAAYPGIITRRVTTLPLFGLAPGGVCRAPAVTRSGGGLLPHRFTLTRSAKLRAVYSLWHFPSAFAVRALPGTLPCGARTFLEPRAKRRRPAALCSPRGSGISRRASPSVKAA